MKLSSASLSVACGLAAASLCIAVLESGCWTQSTPVVTSATNSTGVVTQTTNTVVTVNEANLLLDCSIIQSAVGVAVSETLQQDPKAKPAIQNTQAVINGLLGGATLQSTSQIAALLGSATNTTLINNLNPIVTSLSSLEQSLLTKYGAGTGGQIAIAVAKAVSAGITYGMQ